MKKPNCNRKSDVRNAEIRNEIAEIIRDMNSDIDIAIVEGARDIMALRRAGFEKMIVECSSRDIGEVFNRVADKGRKVSVLTDYDSHGRQLCREISSYLEHMGVKLIKIYRRKIKEVLDRKNIKTIESISNIMDDKDG